MSGDTQLRAVEFQPGINKNVTEYAAEGGWVDADKMRFVGGRPEKIGGWVEEILQQNQNPSVTTLTGVTRALHTWTALDNTRYLASGSHNKLELVENNTIYNITPVRDSDTLNDVITTTNGSSLVSIEDPAHNAQVGDWVHFEDQASPVDGITLEGDYVIVEVPDANNFVVDAGVDATGGTSGGGGSIDIDYYIFSGFVHNGDVTGYGGGTWGTEGQSAGGYGDPRDGVGGSFMRHWSLDSWGEDLIASPNDNGIYHWVKEDGPGTRAQLITEAPSRNNIVLVAQPSRFLVAFGTEQFIDDEFDPLLVRWADQERLTQWDPTATGSLSGEYRLPLGNKIVCVTQTRSEILIFTDSVVYSMRFVGGQLVFQFDIISKASAIMGPKAAVDVNGIVYWMGTNSFYMYDGVVRTLPCSLSKFIYDQDQDGLISFSQKEKCYCATNTEFNEIWWFYQDNITPTNEVNRYVSYNYLEGVWSLGTLERTAWVDRSVFDKPFTTNATGNLYIHESGYSNNGIPFECFVESSYFDIGDGQQLMFVDRIVPDFTITPNRNITMRVFHKKYPNSSESFKGPFTVNNTTRKINTRVRGRQMAVRYTMNATGGTFQVGKVRLGIQPDGGR